MYYTFRQTFVDVYQCTKWDDDRKDPLDTYTVEHSGRSWKCDCPAHVPFCRHSEMVSEMVECDCMKEHWLWYFDAQTGWQKAFDQLGECF